MLVPKTLGSLNDLAPRAGVVRPNLSPSPMQVLRPHFEEALLEASPTRPPAPLKKVLVSVIAHVALLTALLVAPLFFTQALDLRSLAATMLVAPPSAPAPPPPASAVARTAVPKRAIPLTNAFLAPTMIPRHVVVVKEDPAPPDVVAGGETIGGVPGGVAGGVPGGVIGGILGGTSTKIAPPPPAPMQPKGLIRVGGAIKEPRLISRVAPVYPELARRIGASGDVVIDAVIDTQGHVVQMRAVSGHPLLVPAAKDALRLWKYEPTYLNGQPFPVELLVTITFQLH